MSRKWTKTYSYRILKELEFMLDIEKKYPKLSKRNKMIFGKYYDPNFELDNLRTELFPFQNIGVNFLYKRIFKHKSIILGDEQGLGKTIQAISLAMMLNKANKIRNVLIVCPSNVKTVWSDIIREFSNLSYLLIKNKDYLDGRAFFNIISFTMFSKLQDFLFDFDMMIIDEFHYIKSYKAQRTEAVVNSDYKFGLYLSGTPLLNNIHELFTVLNKIDPYNFPDYYDFSDQFCKKRKIRVFKYRGNKKIPFYIDKAIGVKNSKELRKLIKPYFLRRRKKEVLPDLPPKVYSNIYVDLTKEQLKAYDNCDSMKQPEKDQKRHQICQGMFSKTDAKFDALESFLKDNIYASHKAIIVTPYVDVVNKLYKNLQKQYKPVVSTYKTSEEDFELAKKKFQKKKSTKLYIGTIKKNHLGLTLTAADYVIFIGETDVPKINEQMEDRAHRIGQHRTVNIVRFIANDTIETEKMQKRLDVKVKTFDSAIEKISYKKLPEKKKVKTIEY